MKTADLARVPFNPGATHRAGAWTAYDRTQPYGAFRDERVVYHYTTPMLRLDMSTGDVQILSLGWGSVSDQQGVNKVLQAAGVEMRYARNRAGGGPRIVGPHAGSWSTAWYEPPGEVA